MTFGKSYGRFGNLREAIHMYAFVLREGTVTAWFVKFLKLYHIKITPSYGQFY